MHQKDDMMKLKIGAFDKRTIIEFSSDVIRELAKKYANVQKGVGDMMSGALIETSARTILNQGIRQGIRQGISETKKDTALRMLKRGKLTTEEIAGDAGLSVGEVEKIAENAGLSVGKTERSAEFETV